MRPGPGFSCKARPRFYPFLRNRLSHFPGSTPDFSRHSSPRLCGLIRRGAQLLIPGDTAPVSRGRGRACRRDRGLSSRSSDRGRGNRWPTTTNCTRCRRRTAPRPHSPSGRNRGSQGRDKSQTLTRVHISIVVSGAFPARPDLSFRRTWHSLARQDAEPAEDRFRPGHMQNLNGKVTGNSIAGCYPA